MYRMFNSACIAACLVAFVATQAMAVDPENRGPYYEDDAWYDISEWFDGNDYNPTDEVIGRIDDETYDAEDDTGGDTDNDYWYGYDNNQDDNWFYDYYDGGYAYYDYNDTDDDSSNYEFSYHYFDYDGDNAYDAYYVYTDSDGDGLFEDVDYYTFNDAADKKQTARSNKEGSTSDAKRHKVSGEVTKTKKVTVANTKHLVAVLRTSDGKQAIVDLGQVSDLKQLDIKQGSKLTVRGPAAKIGKQKTILADEITLDGRSKKIDRGGAKLTGTLVNTRKSTVRGQQRQIAVVEKNDKHHLVDLGPADKLKMELKKDSKVTIEGVSVKIGDKRVLIAQKITHGDKTAQIDRRRSTSR